MMNREYMKQTYADNLAAWREYRAQIAQDAETLCEIVQNHRFNGGTPEQAAREIVQAIGAENARVIIASAVNAHEGDGRLSAAVIEWAQGIGWDWEMSCNLGLTLDSKMHMCHINQTAEALINLPEDEPEQPETETNEQEESKMFENIIKAIAEAAREQSAKFFAHMETCTTIGALRNDNYVKRYTTPKQCERLLAMDDSEAIPNKDYMKIMNKYPATIQKRQKAAIDKLYAAEAAEMPKNIALHITWTRNNTWGWNPHVECTVDYKASTYGTASGCGYDKTSAAAAEALNASTAILKALYTWVNEGGYTYGVNTPDRLHWISAPYFEGGCGMSTIRAAFEAMGYKCEDRTHYNRRGTEESRNVYFYKD